MTLNPASPLAALLAAPTRPGRVMWIGLRPARREAVVMVTTATLVQDIGLAGDHFRGRPESARQITLIETEDLAAIASYLGRERIAPEDLRRNILVSGINLIALKGRRFRLGGAVLESTGECHPCSRMEEVLGIGGYNAVRGHGGITARVISGGDLHIGDAITVK